MPTQKTYLIIAPIVAVCLFVSYTGYSFYQATRHVTLPVLGQVHDFQLFNEQGEAFSRQNLDGKIWIANFFFTTCSDICPIMTRNMAALHRSFELVDDVTLVSITVNPEFDSEKILDAYAAKFHANRDKWRFLTGPRAQIQELAVKSFKLGAVDEPVFHSAKFALVDRFGRIRGYYDGVQSGEVSQLFKDVAALLKEK